MTISYPKARVFFFHYNKPASLKAGHPVMTVHIDGTCHMAQHVVCGVACNTAERKAQPRLVLKGLCRQVELLDNLIRIS